MVRQLLNPDFSVDFLRSQLPFFAAENNELVSLQIRDVRLGGSFQAQYECRIRIDGIEILQTLVCQMPSPGKFSSTRRKLERQLKRLKISSPDLGSLFCELPDEGLLVFPFPIDPKMHYLGKAVDPIEAEDMLARNVPQVGKKIGTVTHCEVAIARYVAGRRCQIEYQLTGDQGRETLWGKTFKDTRGIELFSRMRQVALLFGERKLPGVIAPKPLFYLPAWRMVFQEHLPGVTLHEIVRDGRGENWHMEKAAFCLHALHSSSLELGNSHLVEDEVALIRNICKRVLEFGVGGRSFEQILESLVRLASSLRPSLLVPVHRDFYEKQILIDDSTVALIDLDTLALGCAEMDLANFVAHLHLSSLVRPDLKTDPWEKTFLETYCKLSASPDPDSLRFFLAATHFRLACRRQLQSREERSVQRLLELADAVLESPKGLSVRKGIL